MVCKFCLASFLKIQTTPLHIQNAEAIYFTTVAYKDIRKRGYPFVQVLHEVCYYMLPLRQSLIPLTLLLLEVLYQHQGQAQRQMP